MICLEEIGAPSEAEIGYEISLLVGQHQRTVQAPQQGLGIVVAECRGALVVGFGRGFVGRPASPGLRKQAQPFQRGRVILRGGLFEQRTRGDIVLRSAGAVCFHQAELKLRFGGIRRFDRAPQHRARLGRIDRRAAIVGQRDEIDHAARIAGIGGAFEQFVRLGRVLGDAVRAGAIKHAEFDHGRSAAFVGGLAIEPDRFRHLRIGGKGAAELVQRAARARRRRLAIFDRGRDVGRRDRGDAFDVRRFVRIGRIGGHPVAQREVGRCGADRRVDRACGQRQESGAEATGGGRHGELSSHDVVLPRPRARFSPRFGRG